MLIRSQTLLTDSQFQRRHTYLDGISYDALGDVGCYEQNGTVELVGQEEGAVTWRHWVRC